jgi:hypothetical protein
MNVILPRNSLLRYNPQCSLYVYLCIYHTLQCMSPLSPRPAGTEHETLSYRQRIWDVLNKEQDVSLLSHYRDCLSSTYICPPLHWQVWCPSLLNILWEPFKRCGYAPPKSCGSDSIWSGRLLTWHHVLRAFTKLQTISQFPTPFGFLTFLSSWGVY